MADPNEFDHVMPENNARAPGPRKPIEENIFLRLLWMIVIAMMISLAQTVLGCVAIIQLVIMLTSQKKPNDRLAEFGTDLGIWVAKAARYQAAGSEVKPWPWTELD